MPEVKVSRPIWIGGKPREAGEVLQLDTAQAVYLQTLERVEIIQPAEEASRSRKKKADS